MKPGMREGNGEQRMEMGMGMTSNTSTLISMKTTSFEFYGACTLQPKQNAHCMFSYAINCLLAYSSHTIYLRLHTAVKHVISALEAGFQCYRMTKST